MNRIKKNSDKTDQISWRVVHNLDAEVSAEFWSGEWLEMNPVKPDPILVNVRTTPFHKDLINSWKMMKNDFVDFLNP
jgi:hypothetical protein